jgi:quercetin dioxygenase-like cupin family protein
MIKSTSIKLPFLLLVTVIGSQNVHAGEKPGINRSVLLENEVQLSSTQITAKTIKVVFPPAFKTPWHTHEGPGPRYIVKGQLKVIEGGVTKVYKAGDVFWESGKLMSVENISDETAEMIIVELVAAKH